MSYPLSPFKEDFKVKKLLEPFTDEIKNKIQNNQQIDEYLNALLKWLCTSPQITTFRVNTLFSSTKEVQERIMNEIQKLKSRLINNKDLEITMPKIQIDPLLSDVIILNNLSNEWLDLSIKSREVIVDVSCASAILRGAHIFAPGVVGMELGIRKEDVISIYADLSGKCKKGLLKKYECPKKLFIGNGIVKMARDDLFGENLKLAGVAVAVTDTISQCPNLGDNFLQDGSALLQNLPSIICSYVLNPQPGETILDMCASPGNKTTHIAALMKNTGVLIAIDKTPTKVQNLKEKCNKFKANVHISQADSTKILNTNEEGDLNNLLNGPPFPLETFDRILLDAPCSGLGKRPQLSNNISMKILNSYVPLQRKLFRNAVGLLKKNGCLVYSTCTITLAENESMVAWALRTFTCLELVKAEPYLGGEGLESDGGLTDLQRSFVQRFGPQQKIDSVGFFLACFIKK